jgi:hypothetical protein
MTFDNLLWIDTNYVNIKENWHRKANTKNTCPLQGKWEDRSIRCNSTSTPSVHSVENYVTVAPPATAQVAIDFYFSTIALILYYFQRLEPSGKAVQ